MVYLGSGALFNVAVCAFRGEGADERTLLRSMLDTLERGDVLLGDLYFSTYFLSCELASRGVDAVVQQNGARNIKTTLQMARLSCLSPEMAVKEIWEGGLNDGAAFPFVMLGLGWISMRGEGQDALAADRPEQ